MSAPTKGKLRILALHGHAMSGELMKAKLGAIRSETKKLADWVFVDGPIVLPPQGDNQPSASKAKSSGDEADTTEGQQQQPQPLRSWYDFSKVVGLPKPKEVPIGITSDTPLYQGVEEAMNTIATFCEANEPIDGVFAFSQGTILAALWAAGVSFAASPQPLTPEQQRLQARLPPLPPSMMNIKFAILASGLPPTDPFYCEVLANTPPLELAVPAFRSLHCWGDADEVIEPWLSKQLMGLPVFHQPDGKPPQTEPATHDGGHVVASSLRKPIKAFISGFAEGGAVPAAKPKAT